MSLSDRQALNDRRTTGCLYDTGLCACPDSPYEYEGCKARPAAPSKSKSTYVVLGLREEVEAWRRDRGLAPHEVIAVGPTRYTGALRGLSLEFELITLESWSEASPELRELVERDLQIIRAVRP